MAKEYQNENISDSRNRCKRCSCPLSDPTANYGWRCAQLLGYQNPDILFSTLDETSSTLYNENAYNKTDKGLDFNTISFAFNVKEGISSITSKLLPKTSWQDASDIIVRNKDAIKNAGAHYGVNPAIIAACIYTEQITNVDILDSMTDVTAYFADTSIGIGQVKVSTAKMLEDSGYIEKTLFAFTSEKWYGTRDVWHAPAYGFVEGSREKATAYRLTVESENINYVAAYLRYFQDRWKDVYPEIDGRTAILASLFNQGERYSPHSNPQPNPFDKAAKDEYHYMRQLLELEPEYNV